MVQVENLKIRWMNKADFSQVIKIDSASFVNSWTLETLREHFKKKTNNCSVIEEDKKIYGFSVSSFQGDSCDVIRLAVLEEVRRQGLGSKLIDHIKKKTYEGGKRAIVQTIAPDDNLIFHLFLKKNEFKALQVMRNFFKMTHDDLPVRDGYFFVNKNHVDISEENEEAVDDRERIRNSSDS